MKIEIDTEQLDALEKFGFSTGNSELIRNCQMLMSYASAISSYYNKASIINELSEIGCDFNPVRIVERNSEYPHKMCISSAYGKMCNCKRNSTKSPKV